MSLGICGRAFRHGIKAAFSRRYARETLRSMCLACCISLSLGCGRVSAEHDAGNSSIAEGGDSSFTAGNSGAPASDSGAGGSAGTGTGGARALGGSAGVGSKDCGAQIDDAEDGSGHICTGSGRVGVWYSFHDNSSTGAQWPAETTPGTPIETSLIPGGRQASKRGIHTYGSGFNVWGAGVGVDLNFDGTTHRLYDATGYLGVHFWARSSGENSSVRFRIGTASTTAIKYGGTCGTDLNSECLGPSGRSLQLQPEWLEYSVTFAELGIMGERDRLTNIQFMTRANFDFWIDDLSFIEGESNCCPNLPACQSGVHFSDAAVRSALSNRADRQGMLDCDRVCNVIDVTLTDPAIQSLTGLECLGALETLTINGTAVVDASPISRLASLQRLDLNNNRIANLGAGFELPKLVELEIDHNQLQDVRPLAALAHLTTLSLRDNRIDNPVGALSTLIRLESLDLSYNQITAVGSISGLRLLETLRLSNNRLTDVRELSSLGPFLLTLDLSHNSIRTLDNAAPLGSVSWLDLSSNELSDIPETALRNPYLDRVLLAHNQLHDLSVFAKVHIRELLDISDNQVLDLTPLLAATGLVQAGVDITGNPLDCAAQSSNLQALRGQGVFVMGCP